MSKWTHWCDSGQGLDVLDALIDDQQANLRRVLDNQGLEMKSVWETKEIFLFGSLLTIDVLYRNNVVYDKTEFYWGDVSESSELTGLAILLWFLGKDEAYRLK